MRRRHGETSLFSYPTPFTPPTTEEDGLSWLRLIRSRRVGPATFWRLLSEHGSAAAALDALPAVAARSGVEGYQPCPAAVARAEADRARRHGARAVWAGTALYPGILARLPDAPPLLWVRGDPALLSRPMVAVVGARNASSLGARMARQMAAGLGAAGFAVVSGLARGIDAEAHSAALATGTLAVMAGGLDAIYPAENAGLAARIAAGGLLLSEQPFGLEPQARHFPLRNRIIAGLARAVVVIEAAAQSGSLGTARIALDQGREVMAVPGHPFDGRAGGCNALIRDGALLVRGAEDVIAALAAERFATDGAAAADVAGAPAGAAAGAAPATAPATAPAAPSAAAAAAPPAAPSATPAGAAGPAPETRTLAETARLQRAILDRLGPSPVAEDQLIRDLAQPAARIGRELVALELDGQIARQPGGMVARLA